MLISLLEIVINIYHVCFVFSLLFDFVESQIQTDDWSSQSKTMCYRNVKNVHFESYMSLLSLMIINVCCNRDSMISIVKCFSSSCANCIYSRHPPSILSGYSKSFHQWCWHTSSRYENLSAIQLFYVLRCVCSTYMIHYTITKNASVTQTVCQLYVWKYFIIKNSSHWKRWCFNITQNPRVLKKLWNPWFIS